MIDCEFSFEFERKIFVGSTTDDLLVYNNIYQQLNLYVQSEVALDFNAGFQLAASGVLYHRLFGMAKDVFQATPEVRLSMT